MTAAQPDPGLVPAVNRVRLDSRSGPGSGGSLQVISRVQAWTIVKAASERAGIRVLALRASEHGGVGEPAPVHPHLFVTPGSARSCG
jgi:hypothetical protein